MTQVIDQMGRQIAVPHQPSRIISLVPSQTELLFDLGLDDEIVGVTKFCVHPAGKVSTKKSIGGTKKFRFDIIDQLQPDLILGNKEENYREGILTLADKYPVWMSDILTLDDAYDMISQVGMMMGEPEKATQLVKQIIKTFASLIKPLRPLRVGYLIWQKPYMTINQDTFIHTLLTQCGFENAFADLSHSRYPELTVEQIENANLDAIFLSSEPFPFAEKHRTVFVELFPNTTVRLVDGEMFSWYGSRLERAVPYFQELIDSLKTSRI